MRRVERELGSGEARVARERPARARDLPEGCVCVKAAREKAREGAGSLSAAAAAACRAAVVDEELAAKEEEGRRGRRRRRCWKRKKRRRQEGGPGEQRALEKARSLRRALRKEAP